MLASIIQIFIFDNDDGKSNQQQELNLIFIHIWMVVASAYKWTAWSIGETFWQKLEVNMQ